MFNRFSLTLKKFNAYRFRVKAFFQFVSCGIMLHANGRNIIGQQLPTLLDVTFCVRLHTLLYVVGSCCAKFKTCQTLSCVRTDATTPLEWLANNVASVCTRLTLCLFS